MKSLDREKRLIKTGDSGIVHMRFMSKGKENILLVQSNADVRTSEVSGAKAHQVSVSTLQYLHKEERGESKRKYSRG